MDPPDVSRSRVLEIGCAAAGNLIPFAATHPLAHTVGVDLSRVAAAVCGHATPGADDDLADPAGFVLAGSLADIVGRRLDDIVPSWLEDLQQRYPRHGLKQHLAAALHAEAKAAPRGRMHLANQAGLPLLIRLAPYPE